VTPAKCVSRAAQNAALGVLLLSLQVVRVEKLAKAAIADTGPSSIGFDRHLSVPERRQPPLFVAAPLAASAVSESESETRVGRRSGNRDGLPPKCHRDLTVLSRSLYAAAKTMTPFKRGVSDLGCGRGHDRRRGQISWSLTPRSPRWRGNDRGDGERSATHADRVVGTRSLHRTSTCSGRQKSVKAGWPNQIGAGRLEGGGTPRVGPCSPSCSPRRERRCASPKTHTVGRRTSWVGATDLITRWDSRASLSRYRSSFLGRRARSRRRRSPHRRTGRRRAPFEDGRCHSLPT
jgi:hypothetical protein